MKQSAWLRENLFVVAAVVLPLAVAAIFLLATALPKTYVDDPQYSLLVSINNRLPSNTHFQVELHVENNRLRAEALHSSNRSFYEVAEVYRFTPGNDGLDKVELTIPENLRDELKQSVSSNDIARLPLELPQSLTRLELSTALSAPDGYSFRNNYRGGAGLFGELFGMRSNRRLVAIEKDGRVVELGAELSQLDRYSYYNVRFLGWILSE